MKIRSRTTDGLAIAVLVAGGTLGVFGYDHPLSLPWDTDMGSSTETPKVAVPVYPSTNEVRESAATVTRKVISNVAPPARDHGAGDQQVESGDAQTQSEISVIQAHSSPTITPAAAVTHLPVESLGESATEPNVLPDMGSALTNLMGVVAGSMNIAPERAGGTKSQQTSGYSESESFTTLTRDPATKPDLSAATDRLFSVIIE